MQWVRLPGLIVSRDPDDQRIPAIRPSLQHPPTHFTSPRGTRAHFPIGKSKRHSAALHAPIHTPTDASNVIIATHSVAESETEEGPQADRFLRRTTGGRRPTDPVSRRPCQGRFVAKVNGCQVIGTGSGTNLELPVHTTPVRVGPREPGSSSTDTSNRAPSPTGGSRSRGSRDNEAA